MTINTQVVLDYTLHDLYSIDNDGSPIPALVYDSQPVEDYAMIPSAKYVYHLAAQEGSDKMLILLTRSQTERRVFLAGKMPVFVMDFAYSQNEQDTEALPADKADVYRHLSTMRHDQQPALTFVKRADQINLPPSVPVAVVVPIDPFAPLLHIVDPDVHFCILAKRGLAVSGLPTPPSTVVDVALPLDQLKDDTKMGREIARMLELIDTYHTPFVVKLPQSVAAMGTFAILSDDDRVRVKAILSTHMRVMLKQINVANYHLNPCSLIFQNFVAGTEVALSFFVTQTGRCIFVGCFDQEFDKEGRWSGGSISYPDQPALEEKYATTIEKTAQFLHEKGYYGPAGVDVLTDSQGNQYVVDLNVRLTGLCHLGFLKGHFTRRGLDVASTVTGFFTCSREMVEKAFYNEFQGGSLLIIAWSYDDSMKLSCGAIGVGGKSASDIERLAARIREYTTPGGHY
ncbi:hypothetical protein MGYG_02445 [Nannizzia gypsea CBS 118893]|uniref:ATP-grasp domain-containing protein n=1 Tax=Arthroderma gypseum (strain ATCC MYA-4604 / CBS 118893) TaxID=535722 RepID=E4UML6_ARTGP|nr:hypothetical protein MGYG_02445 [Nannizzia gypsea CBS 118893]EFQ99433.1 hypothetical protein MGYG_02445 [Nannizzia gypsea CBS 118893]